MRPLDTLIRRFAFLRRRTESDAGVDAELEFHLERQTELFVSQGMSPAQARREARLLFGGVEGIKEESRAARGIPWLEDIWRDTLLGLRQLRLTPAFTVTAVLTLALGIGVNSAIYSVVDAVLLKPLPYADPDRLVALWETEGRQNSRSSVCPANLADYKKRSTLFDSITGYEYALVNLTGGGPPERITGHRVDTDFFRVMAVQPAIGRAFTAGEQQLGRDRVVILGHELWHRRYGADPNILGRKIRVEGQPYEVVGVMPAGFEPPLNLAAKQRIGLYAPLSFPAEMLVNRGEHLLHSAARLKPGVRLESAQAEMDGISRQLAREFPKFNGQLTVRLSALNTDITRRYRNVLWILLAATAAILLIACVNVSSLLLVRGIARRREIAIRLSLGAAPSRVVRELLTQSFLLGVGGLLLGLALGAAAIRAIVVSAPQGIPRLAQVAIDPRVLAVSALFTLAAVLFFGLAPALQILRARSTEAMQSGPRVSDGRFAVRWKSAFVVLEVALCLMLLIGSVLLIGSFRRVIGRDLGFRTSGILAMTIGLPEERYPTQEARARFFTQLMESVRALPAIQQVACANRFPMRGGWGSGFVFAGETEERMKAAPFQAVSPSYFGLLSIPLLRGRLLSDTDQQNSEPVAVVNLEFSRKYLNGDDPIGRQVQRGSNAPLLRIVGVVANVRRDGKDAELEPQVYLPVAQSGSYPVRISDFAIRATTDAMLLLPAVRAEVWKLDKDLPIAAVRRMDEVLDESLAIRRFALQMTAAFALLALLLALVGIYGVISFAVNLQKRELAVRSALGARRGTLLGMVLRRAALLIAVGVALGLAGAASLSRMLETLLFEVKPVEPLLYAAAATSLAVAAIGAGLLPAARAANVDPASVLRYE